MAHLEASSARPLAVITGASRETGLELAKQFASQGFDLLISAADSGIKEAARDLESDSVEVESLQADLARYDGVEDLYSRLDTLRRPVEVLVLNSEAHESGFSEQTDVKTELNVIQLHVASTVHLTRRVVADMFKRHRGTVIFAPSLFMKMPGPLEAIYAASTAFVQSFVESLQEELRETGISVKVLANDPAEPKSQEGKKSA